MNSTFVAIVPWYALVVRGTVMWSRYQFTWFYKVEATITMYYHTYVAVCAVTHYGINAGAAIVTCPSHQIGLNFPLRLDLNHIKSEDIDIFSKAITIDTGYSATSVVT